MATIHGSDVVDTFTVASPGSLTEPASRNVPKTKNQTANRQAHAETEGTGPALHRVREVRLQQGVSLRSAARHTGTDVRTLRKQEDPSTDLTLSELLSWQKALDVPLVDLLEEGNAPLSRPVLERARLLRLMKTATAIHERSESEGIQRMAEMLMEQLIEVMPELRDVSPWHNYGQRRSLDEMGRIYERQFAECDYAE